MTHALLGQESLGCGLFALLFGFLLHGILLLLLFLLLVFLLLLLLDAS